MQWFLVIPMLLSTSAFATDMPPDGKQLLAKMVLAMHNLNYQGTVAFVRDGKLDTMNYVHFSQNNIEQEQLLSLNSPQREIVRQSGRVSHLYPDTDIHMTEQRPFENSFLLNIPTHIEEIEPYYSIKVFGNEEKVALLPTDVVELNAKDTLRYSRKIWIEKKSGLPVKTETFDNAGKRVEAMSFTQLEVKDKVPFLHNIKKWHSPAEGNDACANKTKIVDFAMAPFTAEQLPPGFRVLFFSQHTLEHAELPINHLIIGDGMSFVSVYLEHNPNNTAPYPSNGVQMIGSVKFYSQHLEGYELTVMGEVPEETIALIAKSIKLKTDKH